MTITNLIGSEKLFEVFDRGGHFVGKYSTVDEAEVVRAAIGGQLRVLSELSFPLDVLPPSVDWDSARRC